MKVGDDTLARLVRTLERSSGYRERRKGIAAFNENNRFLRKGMSLTPVKFGIAFTLKHLNQAGALVHVYTDGSVLVNHGGTEMGQGLHTKVAQVVAEEFGIDFDKVRITATKTDMVPNTTPTAASSGVRPERHGGKAGGRHDQGAHGRSGRPAPPGAQGAGPLRRRHGRDRQPQHPLCRAGEDLLPRTGLAVFDRLLRDTRRSPGTGRRRAGGRSSISPTAPPARR